MNIGCEAPRAAQRQPKICFAVTSPFVVNAFLLGHIKRLSRDFQVTVCANHNESDIKMDFGDAAILHPVEIRRAAAPLQDASALLHLWYFYRRENFDAVISVTPKGGLLGMIAARLAGVPIRIHYFTGQVWATKRGPARRLLKSMDWIIAYCSTYLLADSASQKDFLMNEGIVSADKISVLGHGSISGVDTARFHPDLAARARMRAELDIPDHAPCLLYIGRMKKEKGVSDLLDAFWQLRTRFVNLHLLLVGPDEEKLINKVKIDGLHIIGYTRKAEVYMAAADIICLPSYREGFGSVLIEGAACGLPAVASRIYGVTDAVVEDVTGLLHPPGDVPALANALSRLLSDRNLRLVLGNKAHTRALASFDSNYVEEQFVRFIFDQLDDKQAT